MSLVSMNEMLARADEDSYAVGCYNAISLEMIRGVIAGAEARNAPVMICHAQLHFGFLPLQQVAATLVDLAERADVPVSVLLDHGEDFDTALKAIQLGFNSVMYDGSKESFEKNLKETRRITDAAHALGASVEGELGRVTRPKAAGAMGDDADDAAANEELYTDIDQAAHFVRETGIDALAAAFGTAHGVYLTKPRLDYKRIVGLREATGVPIVMHGGSGLDSESFRQAIASGVRKVNYYSGMSLKAVDRLRHELCGENREKRIFLHDLVTPLIDEISREVAHTCDIFGASGKAWSIS